MTSSLDPRRTTFDPEATPRERHLLTLINSLTEDEMHSALSYLAIRPAAVQDELAWAVEYSAGRVFPRRA